MSIEQETQNEKEQDALDKAGPAIDPEDGTGGQVDGGIEPETQSGEKRAATSKDLPGKSGGSKGA
jgi:hypothetical protein